MNRIYYEKYMCLIEYVNHIKIFSYSLSIEKMKYIKNIIYIYYNNLILIT